MPSPDTSFVIVSYVSETTPDLEKWLIYHLSLGVDQIVVYQPPRLFKQPSDMAVFENAGRVQRRQSSIDVGAPLKSAMVSAMTEGVLPGGTLALALNVGEYLNIGTGFDPVLREVSKLSTEFAAWALPVVKPQDAAILEVGERDEVEFRTIFRANAFRGHNGERPIVAVTGDDSLWLDGAGQKIDPDRAFWRSAEEATDDTLGLVIKFSEEVDPLIFDDGSRGSATLAYANRQIARGEWTEDQIRSLGGAGDAPKKRADPPCTPHEHPEKTKPAPPAESVEAEGQYCPDWYREIGPGGTVPGFFKRLAHHSLVFIERPSDTLVVTFDNLSAVNDLSPQRAPWAYKVLRQEGCAHLGVLAHRKDWFREPNLIAALVAMRDQGVFQGYANVILSGTSMGGFAALAFSSLCPGARVLSFSPQSTLDEEIVPWETRFGMGRMRNWRLPFSDAAFEIEDAEQVVVISDPYFELDQRHVDRLMTPNVIKLKAWFSGHFSPVFLHRADLLKPVMTKMIRGTLTEDAFYQLYRNRRKLPWYKRSLEETLVQKGHKELASRVGPAFRRVKTATK